MNDIPTPDELRAARISAGLTQTEAGRILNRSLRGWQDWEYGKRRCDPVLWSVWRRKVARKTRARANPA